MKRHLLTLVLSGLIGTLVVAGDAQACHKKKCSCAPAPTCVAAAPVYVPAPCPAPAPVACAPVAKKHCFGGGLKLGGLLHHKSKAVCTTGAAVGCASAPVSYAAPVSYSAPVTYNAPVSYAAPTFATPQASVQH